MLKTRLQTGAVLIAETEQITRIFRSAGQILHVTSLQIDGSYRGTFAVGHHETLVSRTVSNAGRLGERCLQRIDVVAVLL